MKKETIYESIDLNYRGKMTSFTFFSTRKIDLNVQHKELCKLEQSQKKYAYMGHCGQTFISRNKSHTLHMKEKNTLSECK